MRRCCANCGWLSVNPSGAMFCGYTDERTWEDESCMAWKDKGESRTNADRIRAMTDEELAEWIERIRMLCANDACGRACPLIDICYSKAVDPTETLDWLKKEKDDEL